MPSRAHEDTPEPVRGVHAVALDGIPGVQADVRSSNATRSEKVREGGQESSGRFVGPLLTSSAISRSVVAPPAGETEKYFDASTLRCLA